MVNATVQYKRTIKGSVGAGMGALFNGSGRQYYILEHKSSSKYHMAGTSQKIIIDQIELGRNRNCQVRYDDETWPTVSRKHAAIVKDVKGWKIIPLSKTNSTFVNGSVVNAAWYLQNGDEIQLAMNGPKLGFIQPAGKQSMVSSIRLTERLNLFRQQALKPYKTALTVMASMLILISVASGVLFNKMHYDYIEIAGQNVELKTFMAYADSCQKVTNEEHEKALKKAKKELEITNIKHNRLMRELANIKNLSSQVAIAKKGVYVITTDVFIYYKGQQVMHQGCLGTAFLLDDGRFVTARHCVEPWMYIGNSKKFNSWVALAEYVSDFEARVKIVARSQNDSFEIPYEAFVMDKSLDITFPGIAELGGGNYVPVNIPSALPVYLDNFKGGKPKMMGADWAYAKLDKKGIIKADANLSQSLKAGTEVHVLGFPAGLGVGDGNGVIGVEPIYNKMNIARDGLNDTNCIMVSAGTAHGNSGGPVFAYVDGKMLAIGIVSRGEGRTQMDDQQQQQFDHLVPMCNLK